MSKRAFSDNHLFFFRGRVGLYAILRGLLVGPGDEVILQAFTCVAVPEAILALGATPVWADIRPGSVNADTQSVAARITSRTKAVIAQHTFGVPSDIERLKEICDNHGLSLVEDCCHVGHSTFHDRSLGAFGVASFWSYEWGKPIVAGVGGSAKINSPELLDAVVALYATEFGGPPRKIEIMLALQRWVHSAIYTPHSYWAIRALFRTFSRLGLVKGNYNPIDQTNLAADYRYRAANGTMSMLRSSVRSYGVAIPRMRQIMKRYQEGIYGPGVSLIAMPERFDGVLARFPVLVERKTELLARAREQRLEVAGWYQSPVHPLERMEDLELVSYAKGSCPHAEAAAGRIVSLPINLKCSNEYLDKVIQLLNSH